MKEEVIISIITINYNGLADTCSLLDTISFKDFPLEVIVVDNASSADEATIVEKHYPQVRVVRSEKNLGFAGGNNLGIKAAKGKYMFFINNDTLLFRNAPEPFNFQALVDRLESSSQIGAVCPKIRFSWADAPIQYAGYTPLSKITIRNHAIGCGETDQGQHDNAHPTPYAHGAAMMVKREAIEKAGLMPECYFLYYEEIDWSLMIRQAGYDIWYDPVCTIYHKESQTTGQQSPLRTYYITRNRLLLVKRHADQFCYRLSVFYLLAIVAPKDILRNLFRRDIKQVKAIIHGIRDFLKI